MSGFKGGNGNMQNLMRQAQKMQEEMEKTAELLDDWEIVGTSAGEAVVVYMNAKKIINGIELDESIVDPTDVEMLEDLIMAAINDGYSKADKVYEEKMGKKRFMTGVVAAVTALAMSVSALAAGSIVGTIDMPNASTDKGTISLEPVAPGAYDDDLQKVVDEINDAKSSASVKAAFDGNLPSSLAYYTEKGLEVKGYDISGYKFLSPVMNLGVTGVQASAGNLVKVTFVANNMTDGMIVDILYYCAEHGWEVVKGVRVSGNQVAAYFHSVSAGTPVSLIYKLAAANGGNDNNGNTTTGTSKGNGTAVSPKTGQNSMIPVAGMAVVLLGIGAFAVVRSRKEI